MFLQQKYLSHSASRQTSFSLKMCEIKFPARWRWFKLRDLIYRGKKQKQTQNKCRSLTFIARWCEIVHEVAKEIIKLHRKETKRLQFFCSLLFIKHSGLDWFVAAVSHLDLGLLSRVFDGLEDVPGVSPPHLCAGDVLTVPSLNQDGSSYG